jgi:hypothetical protein
MKIQPLTITTAAGNATEALIEFVEHLRTVTSAGFDALADGHPATASALLTTAEGEVRAVADRQHDHRHNGRTDDCFRFDICRSCEISSVVT